MLKYQVLPQLVSLHFLCRTLIKLGSDLSLFSGEVIFSPQFWHQLEPCHSALYWLSSHWLGSWGNLPHQWCPVSSPSRQLLLLMGAEKLWRSEENSLQLHLGGSRPISMTGQNCQRRSEWATRNEDQGIEHQQPAQIPLWRSQVVKRRKGLTSGRITAYQAPTFYSFFTTLSMSQSAQ